jgi:2-methylcitrate dehydratase PrpD
MADNWRRLTGFALRCSDCDIPATAMRAASFSLLDTLGMTVAAAPLESGRIARETAHLLYGANAPATGARMLFDGRRVSMAGAAFAAASQTDNLDGHDGYNPTKGHIGVALVPALAAVAETAPDFSGPEALAALVIGYEIAGRAGLALHATVSDYHTSGAWNAIGVAALGARLRGMGDEALRQAMGIAEYHGPRSQMMRCIDHPTMLKDGSGWGAMAGISAAYLAADGFTGAPAITVEQASEFWGTLGADWLILKQYYKPFPVCRWAQPPVEAAMTLMRAHGFKSTDVSEIDVETFHESTRLATNCPTCTEEAQYSTSFPVAVALARGGIAAEDLRGAALSDPEILRLTDLLTMREHAHANENFPAQRLARVTIRLGDGTAVRSDWHTARWDPDDAPSDDDLRAKFDALSVPVIGASRTAQLADACKTIEKDGIRPLANLLSQPIRSATTRGSAA